MRERIDTNNAVLALGNWLLRRDEQNAPRPYWITRFWFGRPAGYDLYPPCQMTIADARYYEQVRKLAAKSEYVRIHE
jgi:hypothetical protein